MIGTAARSIMALASAGIFLQIAPALPSADPLSSIGRLSLDACLITAVGVLWKTISKKDESLARKDEHLMTMIAKMTETNVLVIEGYKENRATMIEVLSVVKGGFGASGTGRL